MLRGLGLTNPWKGHSWSGCFGTVSGNGIGLDIGKTWGNGCFGCRSTMGNCRGSGTTDFLFCSKGWSTPNSPEIGSFGVGGYPIWSRA